MALATVITRGYGNGVFRGTIALIATRGYGAGGGSGVGRLSRSEEEPRRLRANKVWPDFSPWFVKARRGKSESAAQARRERDEDDLLILIMG